MNELHFFDELKEANSFLFNKGFYYDSGDEKYDLWIYNQVTTAEVKKVGEELLKDSQTMM